VADVLADHPVAGGGGDPLHRVADVGQAVARADLGDAGPHGPLGGLDEPAGGLVDLADRDGHGGVAVPALDDRATVDRQDVAVLQHVPVGDPVDDPGVGRQAQGGREPVVAEERRDPAAAADDPLGQRVQLGQGDPGPDGLDQRRQGVADQPAGPPHGVDLLGRLAGDHNVLRLPSRAARIRLVTTSIGPMASTAISSPRWA
jgi:hypothetical protein